MYAQTLLLTTWISRKLRQDVGEGRHFISATLSYWSLKRTTTVVQSCSFAALACFATSGCAAELENVLPPSSPRSPRFQDVSAFGKTELAMIDNWLQKQVSLAEFPSLSVAIVSDGKICYQNAFGFEDIEKGKRASPNTSYHVASVTKVFTTTIAARLHQDGVIDLDQPVSHYLPNVVISKSRELGATIRLRQLASHTSGLPRGVPGQVQTQNDRYQLESHRLYDHLASVELVSDPGTAELYSNLAVGLLGHTIEVASDRSLEQLLRTMICKPMKMSRTAINDIGSLRVATGYSRRLPRRKEDHSFRQRLAASGGLVSSAPDLALFLLAQMDAGVLSQPVLQQLHSPSRLNDGSIARTALGWAVRSRDSLGPILKKNGGRNNSSSWIGFSPEHKVGVVVLTNCGDPGVDDIGYWLLERSIPGGNQTVTKHGFAKVAPFSGVRWENDTPIVRVKNRWSRLVAINNVEVGKIMSFANNKYGSLAHKRFGEDLVELLTAMGNDPDWVVTLEIASENERNRKLNVAMTEENRTAVRAQNNHRG